MGKNYIIVSRPSKNDIYPWEKFGHVTMGKNYVIIPKPSKNDIYPWEKIGHVTMGKWLHNHYIIIFPDPIKKSHDHRKLVMWLAYIITWHVTRGKLVMWPAYIITGLVTQALSPISPDCGKKRPSNHPGVNSIPPRDSTNPWDKLFNFMSRSPETTTKLLRTTDNWDCLGYLWVFLFYLFSENLPGTRTKPVFY